LSHRATGRFDVTKTDDPPFDDAPGATLSRAVVTKQFQGDLMGTSVTHMTAAVSEQSGSAAYVAVERVEGTLHGRTGSFVLQHNAVSDRGERSLNIVVVPDSATGELTGLRGTFDIRIVDGKHEFVFDYSLGPTD
jgi:Protein of unknown function (DUF3224)